MKWIKCRAAGILLAFLFGGMASACSMGDVGELLQERMESESVDTEESKQQAEPREAETKQSWQPGNRFPWGNMPMNIWTRRGRLFMTRCSRLF